MVQINAQVIFWPSVMPAQFPLRLC